MSAEEGMKQMLAKTDEHWLSRAESVIDTFHTQRIHAAKLSRQVSQMERDRTLLRHQMVAELIAAGTANPWLDRLRRNTIRFLSLLWP